MDIKYIAQRIIDTSFETPMDIQQIAKWIINRKAMCTLTDRDVVGDLLQPCDWDAEHVNGNNYYPWYFLIGEHFQPTRILEMGVRFGYSLRALCVGSDRAFRDKQIWAVDSEYDGVECLKVFEAYFQSKVERLTIIKQDTQKLKSLPVIYADLAHVDAWHTEDGCYHECELAYAAMGSNGVILVDDTNPGPVRVGAERFCKDYGLDFAFLPTLRGMHIIASKK